MSISFSPETAIGKKLELFWKRLREDNGTRARLKRCKNIDEIMLEPIFHHLCKTIEHDFEGERYWQARMAGVIGAMSHLNRHDNAIITSKSKGNEASFVALFVAPMASMQGDRPALSELRFRRLLQRDINDLYPAIVRVLKMIDGKANLYGLAESLYFWGDSIKKQWAFSYFPKVPEKKTA